MSIIKVTNIKECGSNNTLLWAIKNQADIRSDSALQAVIDNELSYRVTIENVNMFEVFRLIQEFRNQVRIVDTKVDPISQSELAETFPGMFTDPNGQNTQFPFCEAVEHCIVNFTNISYQMKSDDDIISPGAAGAYIPMIARRYTVEIPLSFWDLCSSFNTDDSFEAVFNASYPATLSSILEDPSHNVINVIKMIFVKLTSILKVDPRLEKYVEYTKYAPLKKVNLNGIFKLYLLGFHKFNSVTRSKEACSLFDINPDVVRKQLKAMARIDSPLELEFAVQLPIKSMLNLENIAGSDMLNVACESSMSSILEQGLAFEQSIAPHDEFPDDESKTNFENAVLAYRTRLGEANLETMTAMKLLMEHCECSSSDVFSIIPPMYTTKAVITASMPNLQEIARLCSATELSELIEAMIESGNKIEEDIRKSVN